MNDSIKTSCSDGLVENNIDVEVPANCRLRKYLHSELLLFQEVSSVHPTRSSVCSVVQEGVISFSKSSGCHFSARSQTSAKQLGYQYGKPQSVFLFQMSIPSWLFSSHKN